MTVNNIAIVFTLVIALFLPDRGDAATATATATGTPRLATTYEQTFIKPHLLDIGPTTATINWRYRSPHDAVIAYGESLSYENTLTLAKSDHHSVVLHGLKPDTTYYYKVNNNFKSHFTTLKDTTNLRFLVIGHTHGTEQYNHFPDELLVAKLAELKPDFVVHTGDTTYHATDTDFKRYFFDLFEDLIASTPVYVSPGNHDVGWPFLYGTDASAFKRVFGYDFAPTDDNLVFYTREFKDTRFVFFSYVLNPVALTVLKDLLRKTLSDDKFNIVVFGGAQRGYYQRDELLEFLRQHHVGLIFNGDGLGFKHNSYHGVPIFFVGTGGAQPHPILIADLALPYLQVRVINAQNKVLFADKILVTDTIETPHRLALSPRVRYDRRTQRTSFIYDVSKYPMAGTGKVNFVIDSARKTFAVLYIRPTGKGIKGEFGFRTQFLPLKKGINRLSFILPEDNPFKDRAPYTIAKLKLAVNKARPKDITIKDVFLDTAVGRN